MKKVKNINDLLVIFRENDFFTQFKIKRIGIFGSFARGEQFRDIDLFIEEDIDPLQLLELKTKLESKTGIRFDIMQKKYAEPVILYRALKDMKYATAS